MTTHIVNRLLDFEVSDDLGNGDFSICKEAVDRIEELERALKRISEYHPEITHTWADNVRKIARAALEGKYDR